jgi:hypothetical protein
LKPGGRVSFGLAAGLAALVATVVLAVTRNGGASSTPLPAAPAAGRLGPEGVPIPEAPLLAGVRRRVVPGEAIDGITCDASEQVLFHIHAHLTVDVGGKARRIPAGIGVGPPRQVASTARGAFVEGGSCFMWLHTHSADGIIHTESPITRTYTLGEFFDIWGQPLSRQRVGPARGPVTALFNGRVYTGNPRTIPLLAQAQIQLEVGKPLIAPEQIAFPDGL